jgi:1-acyl-sn-glycerol-3-phosphate acyltransferase
MSLIYRSSRLGAKFIQFQCLRRHILHAERAVRDGPFLIAATHLSHLEPVIVSCAVPRLIRWMARIEFYKYGWSRWVLNNHGCFPVDRFGTPVSSIRRAIQLLDEGELVGIFPEGGVVHGPAAAIRGGPIKKGVCVVARRARVPIVPVVVLGADQLNRVPPWLPFRRGRLWMAFGEPLTCDYTLGRRACRDELARRLSASIVALYQELLQAGGLHDSQFP